MSEPTSKQRPELPLAEEIYQTELEVAKMMIELCQETIARLNAENIAINKALELAQARATAAERELAKLRGDVRRLRMIQNEGEDY